GFLNENTSRGAILTDRKLDELLAIKERRLARRGETKDIQKEIAKRELAKLKAMFSTGQLDHREVNRALQRKTPDVPVAHLPKSLKTLETHCRCGVELTKAQWDDMGMDESPLICPICTDLPSYCKCDSVQEAPKDSPGSGSVPF
ncbi:MAG TPA: hypothetical protein VMY18_13825, partial [Acidobacteriota bacterium]|nr:hypothetical protein [Acidobacteriota bacterium]